MNGPYSVLRWYIVFMKIMAVLAPVAYLLLPVLIRFQLDPATSATFGGPRLIHLAGFVGSLLYIFGFGLVILYSFGTWAAADALTAHLAIAAATRESAELLRELVERSGYPVVPRGTIRRADVPAVWNRP
jgi:hypothetical protein